MERICVAGEEMNGNAGEDGNKNGTVFHGEEIAAFRLPHDGEKRVGSVGIDFTLYREHEGGFLLKVENWSRRKGGGNYRVFETFDFIEEMEEKVLHEAGYAVEIPRKLIKRARRGLLTREVRLGARPANCQGGA